LIWQIKKSATAGFSLLPIRHASAVLLESFSAFVKALRWPRRKTGRVPNFTHMRLSLIKTLSGNGFFTMIGAVRDENEGTSVITFEPLKCIYVFCVWQNFDSKRLHKYTEHTTYD